MDSNWETVSQEEELLTLRGAGAVFSSCSLKVKYVSLFYTIVSFPKKWIFFETEVNQLQLCQRWKNSNPLKFCWRAPFFLLWLSFLSYRSTILLPETFGWKLESSFSNLPLKFVTGFRKNVKAFGLSFFEHWFSQGILDALKPPGLKIIHIQQHFCW